MFFHQFLKHLLFRRRPGISSIQQSITIHSSNRNWDIRGECEMTELLVGLQGGHTKYSCFLCLWNNSADEQHYLVKEFQVLTRSNTRHSSKQAKFCFRHYMSNSDWQGSLYKHKNLQVCRSTHSINISQYIRN